jgi:biopolymer transport protein ExbB
MNFTDLFRHGDALTQGVAVLLLLMSVSSWVVILWKAWMLQRARRDVARSTAAFWQARSVGDARQKVTAFDRDALVLPLVQATAEQAPGSLAAAGDKAQQLTRVLRNALHAVLGKLQFGQVLLATVGSTAPFVGLLGTVWGIYNALISISAAGQATIDKVAGPIGEALIMTALGLAVAIPAVLGYNALVRGNKSVLNRLNRFSHDLHAYFLTGARVSGNGDPKVVPMKNRS